MWCVLSTTPTMLSCPSCLRPACLPACLRPQDGGVDAWLPARDVAPDIVADWEASLERGEVSRLLDMQQFGTERQFLVQWADGAQVSGSRVVVQCVQLSQHRLLAI
jgi:hypothetical protein